MRGPRIGAAGSGANALALALGLAWSAGLSGSCSLPAREACAGKRCGDACELAGVLDTQLFCSAGGSCSPLVPSCPEVVPCVSSADCPAWFEGEVLCQDGALVRGEALCFLGVCSTITPPCRCQVQLAVGFGECQVFLGWAFTGYECQGVGGCACLGPSCGDLFPTEQACASFYESCF